MKVLETKLDELLVKKAPYQLPESFKKTLVTALPWLALISGILGLLGAWGVYQLVSWTGGLVGYASELSAMYGVYSGYSMGFGPLLWVSLALLVVEAVVSFMAFSPLKAKAKRGWDLMFWLALLNVAYAVVYLIAAPNFMQFILSLLGSTLGLYLLFQVRSCYAK